MCTYQFWTLAFCFKLASRQLVENGTVVADVTKCSHSPFCNLGIDGCLPKQQIVNGNLRSTRQMTYLLLQILIEGCQDVHVF